MWKGEKAENGHRSSTRGTKWNLEESVEEHSARIVLLWGKILAGVGEFRKEVIPPHATDAKSAKV